MNEANCLTFPKETTQKKGVRRALSGLLLALFAGVLETSMATPLTGLQTTPEQKYQLALEAQTSGEYETMMNLLRQSAGAGNLNAQEMVGIALLVGPLFYGRAVKSDRCEARDWLRRASAQGSEIAKYQLTFLNRLRNAPKGIDSCQKMGG